MSLDVEESETSESVEHSEEEEVEIDVNAALLEIMVKRTEVLDKLLESSISIEEAHKHLEAIAPLEEYTERKRRRKKK